MPLFLDTGLSDRSPGRSSEAPCGVVFVPDEDLVHPHGALLAVAEGIAEGPDSEGAAADTLKTLADSYYAAPENWRPERALAESAETANQLLRAQGERGRAAALSALVLRQRRWWVAHAGDTRVWLLRDHQLKLLTRDHVTPRVGRRPLPNRACGLTPTLDADRASGELAEGDIFVLTTGGVHGALNGALIMSCLLTDTGTQQMAECLTQRALAAGARGNVTACVARIEKLPRETAADMAENLTSLPIVTPPEPGTTFDGFRIEALIHKSRSNRLYRAHDEESGSTVLLKFPNPRYAREPGFADAFLREEWIGKRIESPHLVRTLPLRAGRRTALYSMMAFHPGENLHERVKRKRHLSVRESLAYATQLLEALDTLHRHSVVHGNVRAKNMLVDKQERQMALLDLGASHVETLGEMTLSPEVPKSSASHVAPELYVGAPLSPRSDIYSVGVTLYHMLTGHYPYGRLSTRDSAPQGPMIPATRYNEQVPVWLEEALERACALDPGRRYASATEFAQAIADGGAPTASKFKAHAGAESSAPRRARRPWEWLAVGVLVAGLLFYLFVTRR
jgi:protein phosphatase